MEKLIKLVVLADGSGTTFQAINDACQKGGCLFGLAEVKLVISNNPDAYVLERAKNSGIPTVIRVSKQPHSEVLNLAGVPIDLVCLAGYLRKIDPTCIAAFRNKIINSHPAPLPWFGGKGMIGSVAVEAYRRFLVGKGEKVARHFVCVHQVDEEYDRGPIVGLTSGEIYPFSETAETIQKRFLWYEWALYINTIYRYIISDGKLPTISPPPIVKPDEEEMIGKIKQEVLAEIKH